MTDERFRLTLAFVGVVLYFWVIHSHKAPIASLAIGLGVVGIFFQPQRLRLPAPLLWFGAFILWAAATSPLSLLPHLTSDALVDFAKLWLIFLVAANVAHSRRGLYMLIIAWLAIYALYPVRGTLFNFMIGHQYWGRYAWNFTFENPNDLAAITLLVFGLAVAVLQGNHEKKWIRLCALAGVGVLPFLVLLTQSRGAILALATMGLLILVQYRRQMLGVAMAVLVAGVVVLAAPPDVWDRMAGLAKATDTSRLDEVDAEGSAQQRFMIWQVSRAVIADHPVTGVGLASYPPVHHDYYLRMRLPWIVGGWRDAHSLYFSVLAETGIIGFLIFMGMISTVFLQGWRVARQLATTDPVASRQMSTLLIGLIGFLQACIFASLHKVAFLYLYLAVVASATAVLAPRSVPAPTARPTPIAPAGWRRPGVPSTRPL